MPQWDVHGTTVFDQPPPLAVGVLAFLTDLALSASLISFSFWFSPYVSIIPDWTWALYVLILTLVTRGIFRFLFESSFGELIFLCRWNPKNTNTGRSIYLMLPILIGHKYSLRKKTSGLLFSAFASIALISLFLFGAHESWRMVTFNHAFFIQAHFEKLSPYVPVSSEATAWDLLPFYYANGIWPKEFEQKPVLFSLPYQKGGPPDRFPLAVHAQFADSAFQILGPKTVIENLPLPVLKSCFLEPPSGQSPVCMKLRMKLLIKHLPAHTPKNSVELSWFEVHNPYLPITEIPQGIKISLTEKKERQTRYLLFNPSGAHQTLILTSPHGQQGDHAQSLLEKTVRSIRFFTDLDPGKATANEALTKIQVSSIQKISNPILYIESMNEAIRKLISKISVDPKGYASYYHLGGTARLLLKFAKDPEVRKKQNEEFTNWMDELAKFSKKLIKSAYLYAKDISPQDKKTSELEQMWIESERD